MFSGKTEELIRRIKRAKIANQNIKVFKPIIDSRSKSFIESHDDHRIAMSFLIAGLKCSKPITVKNCENIFTSFPNFIELTSAIGYKLEK